MDLMRQAPIATALLTGPDQRIELVNDAFIEMHGTDPSGKTFCEAFPALAGSRVHRSIERVYMTGEPFGMNEYKMMLPRPGIEGARWLRFNIRAIRDEAGVVYGALATAVDITDTVLAR